MSDQAWVFCGARRLAVPRAEVFEPPATLTPVADPAETVDRAVTEPLAAPRLKSLARASSSAVVVIPDASRPCPSAALLPAVLGELREGGLADERIGILVGCGLHAPTSAAEKRLLVGAEAAERHAVRDSQGLESESVDLGATSTGAPVRLDRRVAETALVVGVGVVEPHLYAGFSGGVKAVAIGCAGAETIAWTHRPAFISQPGVAVGELAGNPFRETLLEIAARSRLGWAVNAVVDHAGRLCAVRAGDPSAAQAALAAAHRAAWLRPVDGAFDVLVAGVHAPKSESLYQASRAATYAGLAARPAIADGGLLLLCADLPRGVGDGPGERNFGACLGGARSPDELVARGLCEPLGPGGQRAFVLARVLQRFRLAVVGARDPAFLEPLGVAAFDSVDAALSAEDARLSRPARVLAVADAATTVVHAR